MQPTKQVKCVIFVSFIVFHHRGAHHHGKWELRELYPPKLAQRAKEIYRAAVSAGAGVNSRSR